jgi:hypothetical protein
MNSTPGVRRPVYQVTIQRTREPKRNKRRFSELSKKLRIAMTLFVSGCLAWAVVVGTGFLVAVYCKLCNFRREVLVSL